MNQGEARALAREAREYVRRERTIEKTTAQWRAAVAGNFEPDGEIGRKLTQALARVVRGTDVRAAGNRIFAAASGEAAGLLDEPRTVVGGVELFVEHPDP